MVAPVRFEIGDDCPECTDGVIGVLNTRIIDDEYRVRFLGCRDCGWRPVDNQRIVPLEFAPKRRTLTRRRLRRR